MGEKEIQERYLSTWEKQGDEQGIQLGYNGQQWEKLKP